MNLKFNEDDVKALSSQKYQENCPFDFDEIKGCLVWEDELNIQLSPSGWEALRDLLSARGYYHLDLLDSDLYTAPYLKEVWEEANTRKLDWIGFWRKELSETQRAFLQERQDEVREL